MLQEKGKVHVCLHVPRECYSLGGARCDLRFPDTIHWHIFFTFLGLRLAHAFGPLSLEQ